MTKQTASSIPGSIIHKPLLAVLTACLLLAVYIGFLLAANYRTQIALRKSTLKRLQLDLEKRAASIDYFFSERRNDLQSLATSREIASYFINKSLGMSEMCGLKANLFVIDQMLEKVIKQKTIQDDPIYNRIFFADAAGRILADTRDTEAPETVPPWTALSAEPGPTVIVKEMDGGFCIFLTLPCLFQNQRSGMLVSVLHTETLITHFVNYSTELSHTTFNLMSAEGHAIISTPDLDCDWDLPEAEFIDRQGADQGVSYLESPEDPPLETLHLAKAAIHNAPLTLTACVGRQAIEYAQSPRQLLWGTGSLAVVILIGLVVLLRFNARSLIFQARFQESEIQQSMLAEKNRRLEEEISLRRHAETELEKQRTFQMHSDRLRSLGEMAAGIAHELNQPLVGVQGKAEILLMAMDSRAGLDPDTIADRLRAILAQVDRMVHIIDHVRRFAREAGRQETRSVDLNQVVHSGVDLLKTQFQSHGIHLDLRLAPRVLPVQVNPFSIEEVILNLLSNARDALEQRRQAEDEVFVPQVTITTRDGKADGADRVDLEIRDNGVGIAESVSSRMFDPFFTTKDPDKGTGLGLSICKSIVEEFGGRIDFSSTEGAFTAFTVSFPKDNPRKGDDHEKS